MPWYEQQASNDEDEEDENEEDIDNVVRDRMAS